MVLESTWDLIARADGSPPGALAPSVYRSAAALLEAHGVRVVWVEPIDPSGVSPVPPGERSSREANASALTAVIRRLPGVDAVPLTTGRTASTGALDADDVTAAGSLLAGSLRG